MLIKPTTFSFVSLDQQNNYLNLCHSGTDSCRPGVSVGPLVKNFYLIHYITAGKVPLPSIIDSIFWGQGMPF